MFNHYRVVSLSEPAANVRRTSQGEAALIEIHEYWAPSDCVELTSPKFREADLDFQIGTVFINKLHIWDLNNYILTWNTFKTTFHDSITVI